MLPAVPWMTVLKVGAPLLLLAGAFGAGWTVRDWRCDAAKARAEQQASAAILAATQRANDAGASYEAARAETASQAVQTVRITREIYRDVPITADCAAPAAVRGVLDSAVARANAAAATESDRAVRADPADTGRDQRNRPGDD